MIIEKYVRKMFKKIKPFVGKHKNDQCLLKDTVHDLTKFGKFSLIEHFLTFK